MAGDTLQEEEKEVEDSDGESCDSDPGDDGGDVSATSLLGDDGGEMSTTSLRGAANEDADKMAVKGTTSGTIVSKLRESAPVIASAAAEGNTGPAALENTEEAKTGSFPSPQVNTAVIPVVPPYIDALFKAYVAPAPPSAEATDARIQAPADDTAKDNPDVGFFMNGDRFILSARTRQPPNVNCDIMGYDQRVGRRTRKHRAILYVLPHRLADGFTNPPAVYAGVSAMANGTLVSASIFTVFLPKTTHNENGIFVFLGVQQYPIGEWRVLLARCRNDVEAYVEGRFAVRTVPLLAFFDSFDEAVGSLANPWGGKSSLYQKCGLACAVGGGAYPPSNAENAKAAAKVWRAVEHIAKLVWGFYASSVQPPQCLELDTGDEERQPGSAFCPAPTTKQEVETPTRRSTRATLGRPTSEARAYMVPAHSSAEDAPTTTPAAKAPATAAAVASATASQVRKDLVKEVKASVAKTVAVLVKKQVAADTTANRIAHVKAVKEAVELALVPVTAAAVELLSAASLKAAATDAKGGRKTRAKQQSLSECATQAACKAAIKKELVAEFAKHTAIMKTEIAKLGRLAADTVSATSAKAGALRVRDTKVGVTNGSKSSRAGTKSKEANPSSVGSDHEDIEEPEDSADNRSKKRQGKKQVRVPTGNKSSRAVPKPEEADTSSEESGIEEDEDTDETRGNKRQGKKQVRVPTGKRSPRAVPKPEEVDPTSEDSGTEEDEDTDETRGNKSTQRKKQVRVPTGNKSSRAVHKSKGAEPCTEDSEVEADEDSDDARRTKRSEPGKSCRRQKKRKGRSSGDTEVSGSMDDDVDLAPGPRDKRADKRETDRMAIAFQHSPALEMAPRVQKQPEWRFETGEVTSMQNSGQTQTRWADQAGYVGRAAPRESVQHQVPGRVHGYTDGVSARSCSYVAQPLQGGRGHVARQQAPSAYRTPDVAYEPYPAQQAHQGVRNDHHESQTAQGGQYYQAQPAYHSAPTQDETSCEQSPIQDSSHTQDSVGWSGSYGSYYFN